MKANIKKLFARTGAVSALAAGVSFAAPAFAFAAQVQSSSGVSAILPDMNEFIPMLVAFLILLAILVKWGWPVFDKVLDQRENAIRGALEKAEEARIESERVLNEYQDRLIQARQEAQTIVSEAKQQAEAQRSDIIAQAQAESERMISKARETIASEKTAAVGELQGSVADIAVDAMKRVIGEDFSDADHRRLIERSIEEVGNLNA